MHTDTLIIGAGPAGLTTAYELAKAGTAVTVIERDADYVGGISRTVNYKGNRIDIGGHRFFSKSAEIEQWWTDMLGDELLVRPRSSRIYYNGKLFDYPLKAMDALVKLGPIEAVRCVLSYFRAQVGRRPEPSNFEDWIVSRFGRRLFEIFFKTYTEKVWGMPCDQISADWAAQRIKGLDLMRAILGSFGLAGKGEDVVKSLIGSFRYPRLGPGQMWETVRDKVLALGGKVEMASTLSSLTQDAATRMWTAQVAGEDGTEHILTANHVVSTMAINELVALLGQGDDAVLGQSGRELRYRDFLIVALVARGAPRFDDNWLYIHDPEVQVGRIQNFKSWSPHMVPEPDAACYGMEYFCFEGDGLWNLSDPELVALATQEIDDLGLVAADQVFDGTVVRQRKAYPVYDDRYQANVDRIRQRLDARFSHLYLAGRNGMHKYNNQDHAMMTGLLTARNIVAGAELFDVWAVNQDAEYHGGQDSRIDERMVPRKVAQT